MDAVGARRSKGRRVAEPARRTPPSSPPHPLRVFEYDPTQSLGAPAEVVVGDPRVVMRVSARRDLRGGALYPHLVGNRPGVDVPERRPEVFERPAVGAAAGGREQSDRGVGVLVGAAEVVEVLERRRVGSAVDGSAREHAVGLAHAPRERLAVALGVLVRVI